MIRIRAFPSQSVCQGGVKGDALAEAVLAVHAAPTGHVVFRLAAVVAPSGRARNSSSRDEVPRYADRARLQPGPGFNRRDPNERLVVVVVVHVALSFRRHGGQALDLLGQKRAVRASADARGDFRRRPSDEDSLDALPRLPCCRPRRRRRCRGGRWSRRRRGGWGRRGGWRRRGGGVGGAGAGAAGAGARRAAPASAAASPRPAPQTPERPAAAPAAAPTASGPPRQGRADGCRRAAPSCLDRRRRPRGRSSSRPTSRQRSLGLGSAEPCTSASSRVDSRPCARPPTATILASAAASSRANRLASTFPGYDPPPP